MLAMGIAATVAMGLNAIIWPYLGWTLVLAWLAFALMLDVIAERAQRVQEDEVAELRRKRDQLIDR